MQTTQLTDLPTFTGYVKKEYLYDEKTEKFLHLDSGMWYTEEELDYFYAEEKAWKDSLPNYTFFELMDIFGPHCFGAAKRGLSTKLKALQLDLKQTHIQRDEFYRTIINPITDYHIKINTQEFFEEAHRKRLEELVKETKQAKYQINFINQAQKKETARKKGIELPVENGNKITEADVAQAKQVPIESVFPGKLRKMGSRATGLCPLHGEKTASFVVYLSTNTWHCFGCHEGRDVVDFVMKTQKVEFLQAVKTLLNKI